MIHQPASSFYEAQTGEFILVSEDMERDVFMSAAEAQAHGIVDLVAVE